MSVCAGACARMAGAAFQVSEEVRKKLGKPRKAVPVAAASVGSLSMLADTFLLESAPVVIQFCAEHTCHKNLARSVLG